MNNPKHIAEWELKPAYSRIKIKKIKKKKVKKVAVIEEDKNWLEWNPRLTEENRVLKTSLFIAQQIIERLNNGVDVSGMHESNLILIEENKLLKKRLLIAQQKNRTGVSRIQNKKINRMLGNCSYCGTEFNEYKLSTIDHIIPSSKDGCGHTHNKTRACRECNRLKGNVWPIDWLNKHSDLRNKFNEAYKCWKERE